MPQKNGITGSDKCYIKSCKNVDQHIRGQVFKHHVLDDACSGLFQNLSRQTANTVQKLQSIGSFFIAQTHVPEDVNANGAHFVSIFRPSVNRTQISCEKHLVPVKISLSSMIWDATFVSANLDPSQIAVEEIGRIRCTRNNPRHKKQMRWCEAFTLHYSVHFNPNEVSGEYSLGPRAGQMSSPDDTAFLLRRQGSRTTRTILVRVKLQVPKNVARWLFEKTWRFVAQHQVWLSHKLSRQIIGTAQKLQSKR